MKTALLLFLSFQLYAQYPDWVIDSLIFETKLGRECARMDSANQAHIFSLDSLVFDQAVKLSNNKELISTQAQKIALSAEQLQAERELGRVRKEIAQKRIKRAKRVLVLSGAGNVVFLIVLLL